jgi:hypothetical protein
MRAATVAEIVDHDLVIPVSVLLGRVIEYEKVARVGSGAIQDDQRA